MAGGKCCGQGGRSATSRRRIKAPRVAKLKANARREKRQDGVIRTFFPSLRPDELPRLSDVCPCPTLLSCHEPVTRRSRASPPIRPSVPATDQKRESSERTFLQSNQADCWRSRLENLCACS